MAEKAPTSSGGRPDRGNARLGIVVVDPLPIVSEGLELFLESQEDFQVLAQANSDD